MIKVIIKEIVIVLLALVAIALILGIMFYDYIPTNKIAPSKVQAYTLSEEIQNELKDTLSTETQNIVKTYTIDSSDLIIYEKQKDYDKGKSNPFSEYATTNITNSTNNNTANGNNSTNPVSNTSSNGFFNTTGK